MNIKTLNKKLKMTQADFEEVQGAVQKAEQKTSGEISLAIAAESSSYAYWELLVAVCSGCLLFLCLYPLSAQVYKWLDGTFWGTTPAYLTLFYFAICALLVVVLYFVYNIPAIDALIIPEKAKEAAVSARALRYFTQSGVYCTREHSGVLIFVSYFEKQVRILADTGISQKISKDLWNLIADEMTENLAKGNAKDAYLCAVKRCGELLAEYFPASEDNPNELNDGLVVLENEPWL